MATWAMQSHLRSATDALRRALDQAEHVCTLAPSRDYVAKQLARVRRHVKAAEGILVENGCTCDLDDAMMDPPIIHPLGPDPIVFSRTGRGGAK